ncbi:MAG: hypothetical protein H0W40_06110 [Methylibium sp.]|uniref:hypothetical protein n=1 Tax=Methylibium sp. TaxID=2067992 RepID=UPI001819AAF6|nr:hypothetical protein [Methylibium sp.]MBA3596936.1 hypothetical protein [Methylibium sp.]
MDNSTPGFKVDWDCGEGGVCLPRPLAEAPAGFRYDVLADWKDRIDRLHRDAESALYPDKRSRELQSQRVQNERRRLLCERLSGRTVVMAEPLVNGDVLLHLDTGKAVVMYAHAEDVKLEVVADAGHARRLAAQDATGDFYLREDSLEAANRRETLMDAAADAGSETLC